MTFTYCQLFQEAERRLAASAHLPQPRPSFRLNEKCPALRVAILAPTLDPSIQRPGLLEAWEAAPPPGLPQGPEKALKQHGLPPPHLAAALLPLQARPRSTSIPS